MALAYPNGYIIVRRRKVAIEWTGDNATHVLENYLKKDKIHDLNHLQIQKALQKALILKLKKGKSTYLGFADMPAYRCVILFVLSSKKATILTAYKTGENLQQLKRRLG
jgi:hypothetical protein